MTIRPLHGTGGSKCRSSTLAVIAPALREVRDDADIGYRINQDTRLRTVDYDLKALSFTALRQVQKDVAKATST